jgi:hypothetical protein
MVTDVVTGVGLVESCCWLDVDSGYDKKRVATSEHKPSTIAATANVQWERASGQR